MLMINRTCKVFFRATPEELERIYAKIGIRNLSAYLRKIVLRGFVIEIDMSDFKDIQRLLSIESNNLNQYARRANETGSIYKADIESLQRSHKELIRLMGSILDKFNDMY